MSTVDEVCAAGERLGLYRVSQLYPSRPISKSKRSVREFGKQGADEVGGDVVSMQKVKSECGWEEREEVSEGFCLMCGGAKV